MRNPLLYSIRAIALLCVALTVEAQPVASAPSEHIESVLGPILQGNGDRAKSMLHTLAPAHLSAHDAELRTCMLRRLEEPPQGEPSVSDSSTRHILEAYETYWRNAVLGAPPMRAEAEKTLLAQLRNLLESPQLKDVASAESAIEARLQRAGYHSLEGKTGVLHELMIWSSQTDRQIQVALPESEQTTRVFFLDGFVSRGWGSFLTCGRSGTGGWTRPEGLYAVVPAYPSLEDENFRVNFLAHESQHFADQARFPNLKDWEKEYRAKLVELSLANTTRPKILSYFTSSQGDDPADAHSYANRQVLESIREKLRLAPDADLSAIPTDVMQQAATAVLRADSARRQNKST
jgi:hypothetical protein